MAPPASFRPTSTGQSDARVAVDVPSPSARTRQAAWAEPTLPALRIFFAGRDQVGDIVCPPWWRRGRADVLAALGLRRSRTALRRGPYGRAGGKAWGTTGAVATSRLGAAKGQIVRKLVYVLAAVALGAALVWAVSPTGQSRDCTEIGCDSQVSFRLSTDLRAGVAYTVEAASTTTVATRRYRPRQRPDRHRRRGGLARHRQRRDQARVADRHELGGNPRRLAACRHQGW